jgi:hypothetical protein
MRPIRALVLVAAGLVAFPVFAALQVRETLKSADGKLPIERKVTVSGTKFRVDEGAWSLIFDSATGRTVQLHHEEKTWSESTLPRGGVAPGDPASRRYAAAFHASVALLGDDSTLEVRPGDETRTIAGVPAKRVDIYRLGVLVRRSWHASSVDDGELVALQNQLFVGDLAPLFVDDMAITSRTVTLGLAVRVEDVTSGDSMEVVEIRKDKPADALFATPVGYRKVD